MAKVLSESQHLLAAESEDSDVADLTKEDTESGRSRLPWQKPAAVILAMAAVAALVASGSAEQGSFVMERGGDDFLELTAVETAPFTATQACYSFTGGTCNVRGCDVGRGALCESNKCICRAACAGADGVCYTGRGNDLVKAAFTLTNVEWPSYSMYFQRTSTFGQLKATNAFTGDTDKFALYKLPGAASPEEERFLLGSVTFPRYVARVAPTEGAAPFPRGFFATDLEKAYSPKALALVACYNASAEALMFGNDEESTWVYLTRGSWLIYGFDGKKTDVGEGGLWRPSPPLTDLELGSIPPC